MTRPAVDPTTWTSDPPGMFSYYRNGQHFRLAGRDLLEEVSFSSRGFFCIAHPSGAGNEAATGLPTAVTFASAKTEGLSRNER